MSPCCVALPRRSDHGQEPLVATLVAAFDPHWSVQVEFASQLSEQLLWHTTWQVELPPQVALPLGPRVRLHDEPLWQLRLHDDPHEPPQLACDVQFTEQLPASEPQFSGVTLHAMLEQEHVEPLQVGGGAVELLWQPPTSAPRKIEATRKRDRA